MPHVSPSHRLRRTGAVTALGLALVLAGCAESNGPDQSAATGDVPAAAPVQSPDAGHGAVVQSLQGAALDQAFLAGMIPHHRAAVEMAKVELERGERDEVKAIARAIVSSQEEEIRVMTELTQAAGLPSAAPHSGPMGQTMGVPMSMDMATMAAELADAEDVDEMFLQMMLPHHASAIVMADEEAKNGANPELRALAQTIVADQAREIGQMQQLRRTAGATQTDPTSIPMPPSSTSMPSTMPMHR
ncbi:MAG: DUF305 domain-containing protein [Sporichthyaceae bacterium]